MEINERNLLLPDLHAKLSKRYWMWPTASALDEGSIDAEQWCIAASAPFGDMIEQIQSSTVTSAKSNAMNRAPLNMVFT
jgi:hypothetical protein